MNKDKIIQLGMEKISGAQFSWDVNKDGEYNVNMREKSKSPYKLKRGLTNSLLGGISGLAIGDILSGGAVKPTLIGGGIGAAGGGLYSALTGNKAIEKEEKKLKDKLENREFILTI